MQYVMLIYQGDALARQAALSDEDQKRVYADYGAINEDPRVTGGVPMGLPDGPFVAVKEALGGYFVLEADDLDAAIELATKIPAARFGGAIEIRPSETYW